MSAWRLLSFVVLVLVSEAKAQESLTVNNPKIAPSLQSLLSKPHLTQNDSIDLLIAFKGNYSLSKKIRTLATYSSYKILLSRVALSDVMFLAADSSVIFIERVRKPKEELTSGAVDFTLNNIRYAQDQFTAINGAGITASIKEQNFDVTDIDFKGRILELPGHSKTTTSHAAIMATIIGGAGNSSANAKGGAWGAQLSSSDFAALLPDADSVYKSYNISLQNHSYGTGIENYYGADAAAYDGSVWNNKSLVHVFSAGNSGNSVAAAGMYKEVMGFANLTGSFKMAKNIITVGHVDSFNTVLPLSSRGPAFDGRVKPELVAFGTDGSSGAAALVSGTVALLQQAYKEKHNGTYPSAQLIKAVLLNSANDIGTPNIDYTSGYGSLNAYKALQTITSNHFIETVVHQNEIKTFPLLIPGNTSQIKLTLVWTDTPAIANASKSLMNDLDLSLRSKTTGEVWLPWVLSSFPNKDSLLLPAVRKRDTLNNAEQITIDLPTAGEYTIEVKGSSVVTAEQGFSLVWDIDTVNHFIWTYPSPSSTIKSGAQNVIRWETNKTGSAKLEYSLNGIDWKTSSTTVDMTRQYYQWLAPDTVAAAQLRLIDANGTPFSSVAFVLSKPLNLKVGFNCADSFLLYWNKLPVSQYRLYQLGEKYLEPLVTTGDTLIVLKKKDFASLNYAIAPVLNKEGEKSVTTNYSTQGVSCYLKTFFATSQNNKGSLEAELGTSYGIQSVSFQKVNASDTQTIKVFLSPINNALTAGDPFVTKGINRYRIVIQLSDGTRLYSPVESFYFFNDTPVLIYPNPVGQNEPVHLIVKDPFVYSIKIYEAAGKLLRTQNLIDLTNELPSINLSKGFYFIKIFSKSGTVKTQKLIVQ